MKNIKIILFSFLLAFISCGKKYQETNPIRKDITETVFASGNLEADQTYQLVSQSDGYLIKLNFKENDDVKQGQILGIVENKPNEINEASANALQSISLKNLQDNSPQLSSAKLAVDNAKQKMDFELNKSQTYKKLLESNSVSKLDYETADLTYKSAKAEYNKLLDNYRLVKQQAEQQLIINNAQKRANEIYSGNNQVKAVFSGRVFKKLKETGDFVRKGDVIALIGNPDLIYAKVNVDESSIAKLKMGQEAVIQLNVDKDKTYKGKVAEIMPAFNEQTQSFVCKIRFTEKLDFNIINTQLQVNIVSGATKNALLIPRNYLQYGNLVMIKGEKDPIKIETKFVSSEWVQVLSGLDESNIIVTDKLK